MGNKETNFTNKVTKYIRSNYGWKVIKFHAGDYDELGIPDLIICANGKFLAIEIKAANTYGRVTTPRPNQLEQIRRINEDHGGIALWLHDQEDWKKKLKKIAESV